MKKDWLFESDKYLCDIRTVTILVKNNKLLVLRKKNGNEYALPSRHVKIGETLEAGLILKISEEIGVEITCNYLL